MTRLPFAAALLALALPVAAQVTPAANYTDMWYAAPAESENGWGISFMQHSVSNQVFAVWYTYDPREQDLTTIESTDYKPLWIVMPGGSWTSSNTITGNVFVTHGTPPLQTSDVQQIGTFTFSFTNSSNGTFIYNITPPTGLSSSNPAFGLPAFSGVKNITRQAF